MTVKNERNAGRKPALAGEQVTQARKAAQNGETVTALAKKYGVSRQTMSRYLHEERIEVQRKQPEGFTMRMEYMFLEKLCTIIWVDFQHRHIAIENRTNDILHCAFGIKRKPDWEDFTYFLESRCFPRGRDHRRAILEELGLDCYDPLTIIEKTKGRMAEDKQWLRLFFMEDGKMVER